MAISVGTKAPDFTLKTKRGEDLQGHQTFRQLRQEKRLSSCSSLWPSLASARRRCAMFPPAYLGYEKLDAARLRDQRRLPLRTRSLGRERKDLYPTPSVISTRKSAKPTAPLLPDLIGLGSVSARAAFVIDKNGVIKYSEQTPTPLELPDFKKIQSALSAC